MAILLDSPRWPAHGTLFAHLVSDQSLDELFAFADAQGLPVGAFDHDHYDVPAERCTDLVTNGAMLVSSPELLRRLVASGLRVRPPQRTPRAAAVLPELRQKWQRLLGSHQELGEELLGRWQEPQRCYHDVRHLAQMLAALDELNGGTTSYPVALAAWFHDAVYQGRAESDEVASAALATDRLTAAGLAPDTVAEVERLIKLTIDHRPEPGDTAGAQIVDADLSILGMPPARYHYYARGIRLEHTELTLTRYAMARSEALIRLLDGGPLFHTSYGEERWESIARGNIKTELSRWSRFMPSAYYT